MSISAVLQTAHASGVHAVERELAALHAEMLRLGGEEAVRLSVLTLVIMCQDEAGVELAERTVEFLSGSHPARAIVILSNAGASERIDADLSLRCTATNAGQICTEQVRLTVAGAGTGHLSSIVQPLLVPDVPVYVWLLVGPDALPAITEDIASISPYVIIDSNAAADSASSIVHLASEQQRLGDRLCLLDLAWASTRRWRELTAQAFDGKDVRPFLNHIDQVDVECSGDSVTSAGWLIAGWLEDRAREGGSNPTVGVRALRNGAAPHGELAGLRLRCSLDGGAASIAVQRRQQVLQTHIDIDGGVTALRALPMPALDTVHLLGITLEETVRDTVYQRSLRAAAELIAGMGAGRG
ncbi:MAG TPA: glucose-6-phosphate dehydrogenase assembly protein OpcA [Candidatus Sulfotelmatobacter sp.]|nr:glucose-6-phosphate dehydrogenase assembly protein OpcA [Candidatus Sulfotelmatobacter sp.]